jgi:2,3-dihydroxyphenylpropionate 1,2-dioxygenase
MANGEVQVADDWIERDVIATAGGGANEVRCWLAATAALCRGGAYKTALEFYEPVPEWLTGMGILAMRTHGDEGV